MSILEWVLVSAIPAVGLLILWLLIDRWGRRHDPMSPTDFRHLTPGSSERHRSSLDDD